MPSCRNIIKKISLCIFFTIIYCQLSFGGSVANNNCLWNCSYFKSHSEQYHTGTATISYGDIPIELATDNSGNPAINITTYICHSDITINLGIYGDCFAPMGSPSSYDVGCNCDCDINYTSINQFPNFEPQYRGCGKVIKGVTLSSGVVTPDIACVYTDADYLNPSTTADTSSNFNPFFAPNSLYPVIIPSYTDSGHINYEFTFLTQTNSGDVGTELTLSGFSLDGNTVPTFFKITPNSTAYSQIVPSHYPKNNIYTPRTTIYTASSITPTYSPVTCGDMFGELCTLEGLNSIDSSFSQASLNAKVYKFMFPTPTLNNAHNIAQNFLAQYGNNISQSSVYVGNTQNHTGNTTSYNQLIPSVTTYCNDINSQAFSYPTLPKGSCFACVILPPGKNPPPFCPQIIVQKGGAQLVSLCGCQTNNNSLGQTTNTFVESTRVAQCEIALNANTNCDPSNPPSTTSVMYDFGHQGVRIVQNNFANGTTGCGNSRNSNDYTSASSSQPPSYVSPNSPFQGQQLAITGPTADPTGKGCYDNFRVFYTDSPTGKGGSGNLYSYFEGATVSGYDASTYADVYADFSNFSSNGGQPNMTSGTLNVSNGTSFFMVDPTGYVQQYSISYKNCGNGTNYEFCLEDNQGNILASFPRAQVPNPIINLCTTGNCSVTNPGLTWQFTQGSNQSASIDFNTSTTTNALQYDNPGTTINSQQAIGQQGRNIGSTKATPTLSPYPYIYDVSFSPIFYDSNMNPLTPYLIPNSPNTSGENYGCYAAEGANYSLQGQGSSINNVYYCGTAYQNSNYFGRLSRAFPMDSSGNALTCCNQNNQTQCYYNITKCPGTSTFSSPVEMSYTTSSNIYTNSDNGPTSEQVLAATSMTGAAYASIDNFSPQAQYVTVYMRDKNNNLISNMTSSSCASGIASGKYHASTDTKDIIIENNITITKNKYFPNGPSVVNGTTANSNDFSGIVYNGNNFYQGNSASITGTCAMARTKTNYEMGLYTLLEYPCSYLDGSKNSWDGFAQWSQTNSDPSNIATGNCPYGGTQPTRKCILGQWQPLLADSSGHVAKCNTPCPIWWPSIATWAGSINNSIAGQDIPSWWNGICGETDPQNTSQQCNSDNAQTCINIAQEQGVKIKQKTVSNQNQCYTLGAQHYFDGSTCYYIEGLPYWWPFVADWSITESSANGNQCNATIGDTQGLIAGYNASQWKGFYNQYCMNNGSPISDSDCITAIADNLGIIIQISTTKGSPVGIQNSGPCGVSGQYFYNDYPNTIGYYINPSTCPSWWPSNGNWVTESDGTIFGKTTQWWQGQCLNKVNTPSLGSTNSCLSDEKGGQICFTALPPQDPNPINDRKSRSLGVLMPRKIGKTVPGCGKESSNSVYNSYYDTNANLCYFIPHKNILQNSFWPSYANWNGFWESAPCTTGYGTPFFTGLWWYLAESALSQCNATTATASFATAQKCLDKHKDSSTTPFMNTFFPGMIGILCSTSATKTAAWCNVGVPVTESSPSTYFIPQGDPHFHWPTIMFYSCLDWNGESAIIPPTAPPYGN